MPDDTTQITASDDTANGGTTTDTTASDAPKTYDEKYVSSVRAEAAKARVALNDLKSKTEAERKAIAKALGLGEDGTPDPAKLKETLASKDAELRQLRVEGKVRSMAGKHSADAEALLDSRSFVQAIADLDPAASDFESSLADAIKAAVETNGKLKAAAQVAAKGGTEIKGGSGGAGKTFSRSQLREPGFYQANEKEIELAVREGRITQN